MKGICVVEAKVLTGLFKPILVLWFLFSCKVASDGFATPWPVCSPPGSSVCGISQAGVLKWVAVFYYTQSCWPRDWTGVSCIGRQILSTLSCQGSPYWFDKGSYLTYYWFLSKTSWSLLLKSQSNLYIIYQELSKTNKKKNSLALGFAFALKCSSNIWLFPFQVSTVQSPSSEVFVPSPSHLK